MEKCLEKNCKNKSYLLKYCRKHYQQIKIYGATRERTTRDKNKIVCKIKYCYMDLYDNKCNKKATTIFDKENYNLVKEHKWHIDSYGYPKTKINNKNVGIHTLIIGEKQGFIIDHINKKPLDNRKINLRFCDYTLNSINRSGVKGYYYNKDKKCWIAYLYIASKKIEFGKFQTASHAKKVRKEVYNEYLKQLLDKQNDLHLPIQPILKIHI